jgi:ATP-dependent exoDNAse (exonuclease V) beta subunit
LHFETKALVSATSNEESITFDERAALLGTATHKIIQLHWRAFSSYQDAILDKMMILENEERKSIADHLNRFYESDIYKHLSEGCEHRFELEFNHEGKTGFIDLVYFDAEKNGWEIIDFKTGTPSQEKEEKYAQQLDFYEAVLTQIGMPIVGKRVLWV